MHTWSIESNADLHYLSMPINEGKSVIDTTY